MTATTTSKPLSTHFLVVVGAPRTKKTHSQIAVGKGGKPVLLPSVYWRRWLKLGELRLRAPEGPRLIQFKGLDGLYLETNRGVVHRAPDFPVRWRFNCRALFYREANQGDAVGFYQGLADFLEKRGVIKNDSQITSWDGSRLLIDRQRPRVEFALEEVVDG